MPWPWPLPSRGRAVTVAAEVLFHPIQHIHIDEMGVKTCRPVTVGESLLALSSGLELIRSARNTCASPPPADGQQLSSGEFDRALGHTRQIFVAQFLDDAQLKADYEALKDGKNTFTRANKKYINGEVRSRHRTWTAQALSGRAVAVAEPWLWPWPWPWPRPWPLPWSWPSPSRDLCRGRGRGRAVAEP